MFVKSLETVRFWSINVELFKISDSDSLGIKKYKIKNHEMLKHVKCLWFFEILPIFAAIIITAGITKDRKVEAKVMEGVKEATHSSVLIVEFSISIWKNGVSEIAAKEIDIVFLRFYTKYLHYFK